MTEEQARARMAQDDIVDWIAVRAQGPWNVAWDQATATLGTGIHLDLTWIDVRGELRDLYETGDAFEFEDLRVSRSFQGKIEHSSEPLYLPIHDTGQTVNADATCTITMLEVGDQVESDLLRLTPQEVSAGT